MKRAPAPARPAQEDRLRLDAQLCFPIYAAANLVTRVYRPLLAPLGLTYPQYLVMLVLWEQGPVTVKALGERLLLESGTLSPLLQRLERRRLVRKAQDAEDARRVLVSLTARGEALRAEAAQVPEALLCRLRERGGEGALALADSLRTQLRGVLSAWLPPGGRPHEHL